jgi:hypothetical protein
MQPLAKRIRERERRRITMRAGLPVAIAARSQILDGEACLYRTFGVPSRARTIHTDAQPSQGVVFVGDPGKCESGKGIGLK